MVQVLDTVERLDIVSPMPWGNRLLFALLALIPLLAPYELLLRVQWTDYRSPFFVFAAIISAGAVALSMFLVFAAVAGLSSRITLDAAHSTFTYSEAAPIVPQRTRVYPLPSLESVHVQAQEWSDGAPSYCLLVKMSDGTTFRSGSSWSREDIELVKNRIEAFLDRARHIMSYKT
jgi:hypothetical protein